MLADRQAGNQAGSQAGKKAGKQRSKQGGRVDRQIMQVFRLAGRKAEAQC
jgi:hypothetical protein